MNTVSWFVENDLIRDQHRQDQGSDSFSSTDQTTLRLTLILLHELILILFKFLNFCRGHKQQTHFENLTQRNYFFYTKVG